jgi:hypothetical protein
MWFKLARIRLICLFSFFIYSLDLSAQCNGPQNDPATKGQFFAAIGRNAGRTGVLAWHMGCVFLIPEIPTSGQNSDFKSRLIDISVRTSPKEKFTGRGANTMYNAHAYYYEGEYVHFDTEGWTVKNGDPVKGSGGRHHFGENSGGRGLLFQPFTTGFSWKSYNGGPIGYTINKRDQKLGTVNAGMIGHPFIIGDRLYLSADSGGGGGVLVYDISGILNGNGGSREIGRLEGPNGYWNEVIGDQGKLFMVFTGRGAGLQIADITDPGKMSIVFNTKDVEDPMYAQMQDNFVFVSNVKVDVRTMKADKYINPRAQGLDATQFSLPVGNLVLTGGLVNTQGMGIFAHQDAPDKTGPYVGFSIPQQNRTNYPVKAAITLLIHDSLQYETIKVGSTLVVRPVDPSGSLGSSISGRATINHGDVLMFTPDQDLQANTTYQVDLPAGGIKDAVGNGMQGTSFRFSTGNSVVAGGGNGGGGGEPVATPKPVNTPISGDNSVSELFKESTASIGDALTKVRQVLSSSTFKSNLKTAAAQIRVLLEGVVTKLGDLENRTRNRTAMSAFKRSKRKLNYRVRKINRLIGADPENELSNTCLAVVRKLQRAAATIEFAKKRLGV